MVYTFEIIGVAPALEFFYQQQELAKRPCGVEYLGTRPCTLDALLQSLEELPARRGWDWDQLVEAVIRFWCSNPDLVSLWRSRLRDAGEDALLVSRVGHIQSLQREFEWLLNQS
ncbi:hypothetical protein [Synechococcus sp. H65.1]|uniref:hypothetical protein n=1 Tax=unclassified Synechococcus TaxID=2626047 RepID=UPI0039C4E433